jgi:Zn finger protein HypA/HybF involved in hydrogenase expression
MATLELQCSKCDFHDFGNVPLKECPSCDAPNLEVFWDEEFDCHEVDCCDDMDME